MKEMLETPAAQAEVQGKKKRKVWPWILGAVLVLGGAAAALAYIFRPIPLELGQAYVAADGETAEIYDEEGTVADTLYRGTPVTYVIEEQSEERPGQIRLVTSDTSGGEVFEKEAAFVWIDSARLVDDLSKVVQTEKLYIRTTMNLLAQDAATCGALVERGDELKIIGYEGLDDKGVVARYHVQTADGEGEGYVTADYLCRTEEEATAVHDKKTNKLHAKRGDDWGGGDAGGLDYEPRVKPKFADNVMPEKVKALYLNNEFIADVEEYIDIADDCGINAFVIDIQDGGAIAYASPTMEKYSPSAYKGAYNTLEEYREAVKKIKDAGYYIIGRITTFNDPYFAEDHPECLIVRSGTDKPMKIVGMYWPSAYNRYVWQYKVDLALEAVELMGFNEIQFDYVRFPDGTWYYDDDEIDYRNTYGESKAQAVQRFLMYAADRIHAAGAYISADVFGETSMDYVCAYGQYWPAISNVVDVISAMPYPDHYGSSGDWLPWEHPYDTMYGFGSGAAKRQKEIPTPASVRTWVQAYNAIHEPYTYYGPNEVAAQIKALEDTGNTGGYMTWNAASSISKYRSMMPAFD